MLIANYILWLVLPVSSFFLPKRYKFHILLIMTVFSATFVCITQDTTLNKDREAYISIINAFVNDGLMLMDPGLIVLVKILSVKFSGETLYTSFFLVTVLLSVTLKMILFHRYGGVLFGCLMMYFSYYFLTQEMTVIRAGLAIGLLYFSWFSWIKEEKKLYYLFGLLATTVHISSVAFLLAPYMLSHHNSWRWRGLLSLFFAMILANFLRNQWLFDFISLVAELTGFEKINAYIMLLEDEVFSKISFIRLLPHILIMAIYFYYQKKWHSDIITAMLIRIQTVGILTFLAFSTFPVFSYRLSDLFLFSNIFLIGRLRYLLSASLYYHFVVFYTGCIIFYTINFSGLYSSNF